MQRLTRQTWLDDMTAPSGTLAKCKVCNGLMNLLLQLHGDIPQRFPDHERRLYIWACRRKACRRKEGSVRGFRAVRGSNSNPAEASGNDPVTKPTKTAAPEPKSLSSGLGEALFGVKPASSPETNPFASPSTTAGLAKANPFAATSALAAKPAQKPPSPNNIESLPETFADKVKISSSSTTPQPFSTFVKPQPTPSEPWPSPSSFPNPFPVYHIDADKEYLDAETPTIPGNARLDPNAMDVESSSSASGPGSDNIKDVFESSMDKTFQRFADRLAQNPEQILRYEFGAQPLLYARTDRVGKLLAQGDEHAKVKVSTSVATDAEVLPKIPRCENCGAGRCFELQLTPHAIAELEADELTLDGMDWGTIILAVCSRDCLGGEARKVGEVGYVEEWVGVQWEEVEVRKK